MPLELTHETKLRRRDRFLNLYYKACALQQRAWFKASTVAHRTIRGTHLRASYGQDLEIAECFVLLSVVYDDDDDDDDDDGDDDDDDGTFKLADKCL